MKTKKSTPKEHHYAGFWRRFVAYMLDGFIIGLLVSTFSGVFFRAQHMTVNYFPSALIGFAYTAFFWVSHTGQTIGKKLIGIKIIRQDEKPIDLTTAITRYIGYLISGAVFCLGYISAGFNPQKLAWHDRLAKTYVIVAGKSNKFLSTVAIIIVVVFGLILAGGIATGLFVAKKAVDTVSPEHFKRGIEELKRLNQNLEKLEDSGDFNAQELLQDINDPVDQLDTI